MAIPSSPAAPRIIVLAWLALAACDRRPAAAEAPGPAAGELDARTPVPLLPMMAQHQKENMRAHLTAVREMVAALATDDFAKIATAASSIGYSEQMAMMCSRMGAATAGFADVAIRFHQTADTIADAARHEDRKGVLAALDATLQQCVGCHAVYRQQVVSEAAWQQLTGQPPPMGGTEQHKGG